MWEVHLYYSSSTLVLNCECTCNLWWVHLYTMKGEYVLCGGFTCTMWWAQLLYGSYTLQWEEYTCTLWWVHLYSMVSSVIGTHVLCDECTCTMWLVHVHYVMGAGELTSEFLARLGEFLHALLDVWTRRLVRLWRLKQRQQRRSDSTRDVSYHVILTVRVCLHCMKADANLKPIFSLMIFVAKAKATSLPDGFIQNQIYLSHWAATKKKIAF